jgi:hypothetical protein
MKSAYKQLAAKFPGFSCAEIHKQPVYEHLRGRFMEFDSTVFTSIFLGRNPK